MTVPYEFIDVDQDDQAAELVEEWNGGTRRALTLWRALTRPREFAD